MSSSNLKLEYDVLVIGAGAGGISAVSSLLQRQPSLSIGIVDPAEYHYYQPGWTMVGAGVFTDKETEKSMSSLIPNGCEWIQQSAAEFNPETNSVKLESGIEISYKSLIIAPGLRLAWEKIEGLEDTLGKNGVTSNYRYDLAPYTWQLVQKINKGNALFTQPPMPIKCAGAPQKVMYLSSDHWLNAGKLKDINVSFLNAGPALFGVQDYVPALMKYIDRYDIQLNFNHNLVKVDGPNKKAWFKQADSDELIERDFDLLHVCPPQVAPEFIANSSLSNEAGWLDVNQDTLQHSKHMNIWGLGDVISAPNAKTAAAARVQAPVVATNVLMYLQSKDKVATYNGYGSCPLTVEKGKIVLAEFGYGGKLLPSFPKWLINGQKPSRLAWFLKERILPEVYWRAMLKGKEWLVKPVLSNTDA